MNHASTNAPVRNDKAGKRYRLITFMRIEPEDAEPMTHEEALAERRQQELLCPENIYLIEEEGE